MFASKLLLLAVAVVSVSAATPTNSACSQPTATITAQADIALLESCETFTGDILITPDASGALDFSGPSKIAGDLIVENAGQLTSFGSSTIASISGTFNLNNLTILSTLAFTELESVGSISWEALPALSSLTFTSTVSQAASVVISNTFLSTLDGINLQTVATLNINNNNRLKTFSTQVGNITNLLNIDSNGNQLDLSFPNLIWAANVTIRNVSTISIPSLSVVNGSLGFYENYFTSVLAPNLTQVGITATGSGGLAFVANPNLSNLTIPLLSKVGGALQIANNSALYDISFPDLSTIGGAIDFSGNFSTPQLPGLTNVAGGFNLQSESSIDCSSFQSESKSGVIQGKYQCVSSSTNPQGASGTATGSAATPTSSKKGAAVSYGVSAQAVIGLSLVGGLLQILL